MYVRLSGVLDLLVFIFIFLIIYFSLCLCVCINLFELGRRWTRRFVQASEMKQRAERISLTWSYLLTDSHQAKMSKNNEK